MGLSLPVSVYTSYNRLPFSITPRVLLDGCSPIGAVLPAGPIQNCTFVAFVLSHSLYSSIGTFSGKFLILIFTCRPVLASQKRTRQYFKRTC